VSVQERHPQQQLAQQQQQVTTQQTAQQTSQQELADLLSAPIQFVLGRLRLDAGAFTCADAPLVDGGSCSFFAADCTDPTLPRKVVFLCTMISHDDTGVFQL
jgi:hypothetical protein